MRLILPVICSLLAFSCFGQTDTRLTNYPVDSGYISSFDGTKIYYESRGIGKPVLLVHGFIVNSNMWKSAHVYTDLVNAGYRVVLIDLRGNGKSDRPQDSTAYDNDAEAKDIMLLMNHLKIKQYSAIGYSRGSIITARLMVLDKRVKTAVFGGMGIDFTNPDWPRRIMFYNALKGDNVPELQATMDYITRQGLDRKALMWMQRSQPSTPQKVLAKMQQPVLIACGDKDETASASALAKLFRNATFKIVPGDHGAASRTPEFSSAVLDFLNSYFR
ncbi:MAG: alpha/beta hydrolase [Bacteroidetes bacterium]|nr:alpha/beta hydrolase [Bacteroidota bacterium]